MVLTRILYNSSRFGQLGKCSTRFGKISSNDLLWRSQSSVVSGFRPNGFKSTMNLCSSAGKDVNVAPAPPNGKPLYDPVDPVQNKEGSSIRRMLLHLFGFYGKASTNIRSGQALFRSCEEQSILVSQDESFGLDLDWYDTKNYFNVRQQLLMLHVWMVHRRLLLENARGKDVQEHLFDTLWDYTQRCIRATGVHELTVNKHLSQVQKVCFTAAVQYDHGLNVKTDENLELGSAIWRTIYMSDPKTPDECVYRMADYVRNQIDVLNQVSSKDLFHGKLIWIDLENESSSLAGEWRQAIATNGRTYWWNVKTRESRWTKPDENL